MSALRSSGRPFKSAIAISLSEISTLMDFRVAPSLLSLLVVAFVANMTRAAVKNVLEVALGCDSTQLLEQPLWHDILVDKKAVA